MDTGKVNINLSPAAPNIAVDPDGTQKALDALYNSMNTVRREIARSPGLCDILCSVAINKGQCVNINSNKLRLADRTIATQPAVGICIAGAAAGKKARIILLQGYTDGLAGLAAGSVYYLDAAGAITNVKPGAGLIQPIGFALSATEMLVSIGLP